MHAEKALRALLMQSSAVTALVSERCYPLQLPQDCPLPALVTEHISSVDLPHLDAAAAWRLVQTRMQVSAVASSYPDVLELLAAIRSACRYQRGLIAGVQVASVLVDITGPDSRDDDMSLYSRSVDFLITYHEP